MSRASQISIAVAIAAGLAASPAMANKADDTVRFAYIQTLASIDPYYNGAFFSMAVADQIWDTLLYRDPDTGEYKGDLATAWRRIDDRVLEFDLRQGVRFHNGAAFGADDVLYTLNFVSRPENKSLVPSYVRWIDHVEKLGPYKVRIVTREPFPAALAYLATPRLAIFPHEYYAAVGPRGMNARPIGTGPYRVAEHSIGKYLRLKRNADYFRDSPKPQPKIGNVEIRFIPDRQTQVAETVSGGLDLIEDVPRDQAEQLADIRTLAVIGADTMAFSYLKFNARPDTPAPQLRDVRVRRAIGYAIDREAIVKYIVGAGARVLHTECYPGQSLCTDQGVTRYPYDPVKARRLLADAGYANGFAIDLYAANSASGNRNEVEAVIGYLKAVGIQARLRMLQIDALGTATRAGKTPLVIIGLTNSVDDISNAVANRYDFSPLDMARDAEMRDLLHAGESTIDPALRGQIYDRAFKTAADRLYILPLHSMPTFYVAARGLAFKPHADIIPRFYEMSWK